MSLLLELCLAVGELAVDRALDDAVINGDAQVGGHRVRWDRAEGFTVPFAAAPASLHEGRERAAAVAGDVPGLLGFHPEMSVVVAGTTAAGSAAVTLRYDLPDRSPASAPGKMAGHAAAVRQR